jgi:predicted nuclease of predicted toxin-antitoxin system
MMLKLDENLGGSIVSLLRLAGHDVATVVGQQLSSTPDAELIEICRQEGRCLVTLDRGFGNRLRFSPEQYPGIVVIRVPPRVQPSDLREAVETLIQGLERAEVSGKLWIIRRGEIQEYQPISEEEE